MVGNTFLCLAHTYSLNEDEYMKLSRADEEKKDESKDEIEDYQLSRAFDLILALNLVDKQSFQ